MIALLPTIAAVVSAAAAPVSLVILDAAGDPVGAQNIVVSGQTVVTDQRGRVSVDLPEGTSVVQIAVPGYAVIRRSLAAPSARPVRVVLRASEASLELVVEGERITPHVSRHVVDAEKAEETPGALDDAVRLVQSLPGVTVQREYSPTSGALSVRGAAPQDSRYFLDGIEIPYLYHFNQYASVFPTSQIGQLELLPSTFSAAYGDATGAVVDARSKLDAPASTRGNAHLNFVMVGGDVRAPLGDGWWVSVSGRRSYQDLVGEQSPQYPVWPVFHDGVVRLERGDAKNGTGMFAMTAGDGYQRALDELDLLGPVEAEASPIVAYREAFQIVGAHHRFQDSAVSGRVVAAVVHHRREGALAALGQERLDAWTGVVRADLEGRLRRRVAWDGGVELRAGETSLAVAPAGSEALRVARELPALARGEAVDGVLLRRQLGVYGTARLGDERVLVMPGVRVDHDDSGGGPQLNPRVSARFSPNETTAIKLAGGRYTQRPRSEHLFVGAGDPALPTTTSLQVAGGVEQRLGAGVELSVDAYVKAISAPVLFPVGAPAFAADAGEAAGVEVLARYRLRERLFVAGWVGAQRATVAVDGRSFAADGDQRFAGGFVASWDVGRYNLGLRYRGASGLPFTQLEGSVYDASADQWVATIGDQNSVRMPAYHKVDLRAAGTWDLRGVLLTLSAEVWIVPRSAAQLYPTWNFDYSEQAWVVGPTVLPLLGAKASF